MKIYDKYILSLVLSGCLVDIMLAIWGQDSLEIYFIANAIVYLVITLLYASLNPKARRTLDTIALVLFGGFGTIVALKVMQIVSGK